MRYSLAEPFHSEQIIKKSRFLVQALPLTDPQQAPQLLQQLADASANHNCWAWQCGQQYRFSDDGEPAGTAGKPILTAIQQLQCDQLLILVTRWFGGIKLGAGGLIRAYHGVAAHCLQQAPLIELIVKQSGRVQCSHAQWPQLQHQLAIWQADIIDQAFLAEYVTTQLAIAEQYLPQLQAYLQQLTKGQFAFVATEQNDH